MIKGATKSLGQKEINDKFYTKPKIAAALISEINIAQYDLIIEPAAGNGSFSKNIPSCIAMDIIPEDSSVIEKDFFSYTPSNSFSNCLVIGNPPFGQQASLAIKFFNHAAEFANTIAFILPKSFRKVSVQNRLSLDFSLKKEISMEENTFLLNGQEYSVPCVFQIWKKSLTPREKVKLPLTSNLISFIKNPSEADFRIQRVGGNAGKAFLDKNGAASSNYYLKNISNYETSYLISVVNSLSFPSINDTVGPKSLPKGELIYELETTLFEEN